MLNETLDRIYMMNRRGHGVSILIIMLILSQTVLRHPSTLPRRRALRRLGGRGLPVRLAVVAIRLAVAITERRLAELVDDHADDRHVALGQEVAHAQDAVAGGAAAFHAE